MGKQDLQAFINNRRQIDEEAQIDWNQVKLEWLNKLKELYKSVENWLTDLDAVKIYYSDIELNEENIGIYAAKKMIITISDEQVLLEPVGTRVIGVKGRVDMNGKSGKVRILLVPKDSQGPSIKINISNKNKKNELTIPKEWRWKLATQPPVMKYIELDGDSFSDALLESIGE